MTEAAVPRRGRTFRLTVLGTTDLHGHVLDWDYVRDAEYHDAELGSVGLAQVATLVNAVREDRGAASTVLLDAGDTIQGTPLATYFAKVEPISATRMHPMAAAMNLMGYDAAALGNHEFDFGIPLLRTWQDQLDFPLLGANAVGWDDDEPAFPPYLLKDVHVPGGTTVRVGVLGLTNPGVALWDKYHVDGRMRFTGLVEAARTWVPRLRAAGADVVVVAAHSGATTSSSYGAALPYVENASTLVARQVPGIDAILVGHAHREIVQRYVTNEQTGAQVLLTEPLCFGARLSVIDLDLELEHGRWQVVRTQARLLRSDAAEPDPGVERAVRAAHDRVVEFVRSPVGTCREAMPAASARYEDVPLLGFVNHVQAEAVKSALPREYADLPVLSVTAPLNRQAVIPAGQVRLRDLAGVYAFDNALVAVLLTGSQLKDYLERSAEYFRQVDGVGPHAPDDLTDGTPDYDYDVAAGIDEALTYDIDIAGAPGGRIVDLAYGGAAVAGDQRFVVAVNTFRQSGGGGFPHVADAEVVDDRQQEVRQLLVDWLAAAGELDPARFASSGWRLVADGEPVQVTD